MDNIDDELNAALGVPGQTALPVDVKVDAAPAKVVAALHKAPKSRTSAEQTLYDTIKEQVLADLIKDTKGKLPAAETAVLVDFYVNLPVHAGMICIDGRQYYHGFTYKIKEQQVASFAEIAGKAWAHDEEVRGQRKPFDSYRLTRGV